VRRYVAWRVCLRFAASRRFRERPGLSRLDLAFELEISTTFLSDIKTCRKRVSPEIFAKIAKALKTEIYEE
jgi:transcriptional regulator with XRE-family HTH domain